MQITLRYASAAIAVGRGSFVRGTTPLKRMHERVGSWLHSESRCGDRGVAQTRLIGALAALLSLSLIGERGRGGEVCYTGEAAFRSHKIVCANDSCGYAELLQCCFALLFLSTDKPNTASQSRFTARARHRRDAIRYE